MVILRHRRLLTVVVLTLAFGACALTAFAQDHGEAEQSEALGIGMGLRIAGLAIGAGLALGLAGLATAKVQASVGAAGMGALAEKPELFSMVLILYAIPETIVVLGFVIAILLVRGI